MQKECSIMGEKEKEYYRQHAADFKKSHNEYMKKNNFVEIKVRMTEEKRSKVKEHAASQNESASTFINRAIDETIKRDNKKK